MNNKKTIYIIYHNADFDGIGSAAILAHYHKEMGDKVYVYGWSYGAKIPDYESFGDNALVYIVDVVLPYNDMKSLLKRYGQDFIWIDHHITAEAEMKDLKINSYIDIKKAAIEGVWNYVYPHITIPYGIKLIANYDIWDLSDDARMLNYAMFSNPSYKKPKDEIWSKLCLNDIETLTNLLKNGKIIMDYQLERDKRTMASSHLVKMCGYAVPALNSSVQGSEIFENNIKDLYKKYPFVVIYYKIITGWKMSLYSNRLDINLSEIAKEYGFKGHRGACGAMVEELPFEFLNQGVDKL